MEAGEFFKFHLTSITIEQRGDLTEVGIAGKDDARVVGAIVEAIGGLIKAGVPLEIKAAVRPRS